VINAAEYKRCKRVIEWMLTAHSTMRDRYTRRSRGLTLVVMALSITGVLLALANGDQMVSILGLHGKLQVFLGVLAALVFFFSLLDLVVDWRQRAWLHKDAAERLGELSLLFRRARAVEGGWAVEGLALATEYERVMSALHPLPERKVMALKALHNRKRAQFTRADERPGAPAWWIRLTVLYDSFRGRLHTARDEVMAETPGDPEAPDRG
jgi:hypothetical protein